MLRGMHFNRCRMAVISMCQQIALMRIGCLFASTTAAAECHRNRWNDCLNPSHQRREAQVGECQLFIKLFATIVVQSTFAAAKEKERQSASSCRVPKKKSEDRSQKSAKNLYTHTGD